jgi:hypothetical protein
MDVVQFVKRYLEVIGRVMTGIRLGCQQIQGVTWYTPQI